MQIPFAQTYKIYDCIVTTILIYILCQSNMIYQSQTPYSLQTQLSTYMSELLLLVSLRLVSPPISSFLTCPTSQTIHPFCRTSKSSHSCWYHASAPNPYISLFITILCRNIRRNICRNTC